MNRAHGFTLIELLFAMGIMGVVFVLILNWQTTTLQTTTRSNTMAEQLQDLNDLTGYVGDRVRAANVVRLSGLTVNASSASNAGKCDSTTPCLAALVLDEEVASTGAVTRTWNRLVFRVESRSGWTSLDKVDDAWADNADNKIVILREYRDTCTETTTTPPTCSGSSPTVSVTDFKAKINDAAFSGMSPQLVADNLTSVDQGGAAIVPFALQDSTKPLGPGNPLVLTFQSKRNTRGQVTFVPTSAPLQTTAQPRNLAP